jgi:hypothetical protein
MAHSELEILINDINEYLRRVPESRRDFAQTIAMTRKTIDESRTLMIEIDAILARR